MSHLIYICRLLDSCNKHPTAAVVVVAIVWLVYGRWVYNDAAADVELGARSWVRYMFPIGFWLIGWALPDVYRQVSITVLLPLSVHMSSH